MIVRLQLAVARQIARGSLWEPDHGVAVAVSGGLDSVVLLDLLVASAGLHRGRLSVVTVDHGTREGSAADADFVEALADSLGLACSRHTLALHGASEARMREARYSIFDGLSVDRVALAHHADDQVETALFGWMRGAGTAGMAGMPERRGRYVRPLLSLERQTLEDWAQRRQLRWREDPSNQSPRFVRNRLRHEVLPVLESIRSGSMRTMARGVRHARQDAELLDRLSREADPFDGGGWPRSWVCDAPAPLVRRALIRRLGEVGSTIVDDIVRCAERGRGTVVLSPKVQVVVSGDRVLKQSSDD